MRNVFHADHRFVVGWGFAVLASFDQHVTGIETAAGDAMGMPTSMMSPETINEKFGEFITEFLPAPEGHKLHADMVAGQVTDDTQQTLLIADSIIKNKKIDPQDIAAR